MHNTTRRNPTRKTGHHETRNPIHTHNDTQHNKATQKWTQTESPLGTSTKHDTPRRTTTPHHYTQRKHHHKLQPDATIYQHHDMKQHSAAHRDAPRNGTAAQRNVPQGGTRQKPSLHNNVTQHATPQPNGSYTTPHNTAQYCTAQPTAKKKHKTRHCAVNARHHNTPPKTGKQHNTAHATTRRNSTTTRRHTTQRQPTQHNTTTRLHNATPPTTNNMPQPNTA